MGIASLVIGIVALSGVCLSLVPLLNVLNCFILPFAIVGALLGLLDVLKPGREHGFAVAGLVINLVALMVGGSRFLISLFTTGGIL